MLKETAQNNFYEISQLVFAPRPYYSETIKKDSYSVKIFFSKEEDKSYYFIKPIKELMAKLQKDGAFNNVDLITFIPRSQINSYSITLDKICYNISNYLNVPFEKIIVRVRNTHSTGARLPKLEDRYESVKDSMKINRKLKEKKILLFDDVKTTGCSILEAKKILMNEGVKEIVCICFGINQTEILKDFIDEIWC